MKNRSFADCASVHELMNVPERPDGARCQVFRSSALDTEQTGHQYTHTLWERLWTTNMRSSLCHGITFKQKKKSWNLLSGKWAQDLDIFIHFGVRIKRKLYYNIICVILRIIFSRSAAGWSSLAGLFPPSGIRWPGDQRKVKYTNIAYYCLFSEPFAKTFLRYALRNKLHKKNEK